MKYIDAEKLKEAVEKKYNSNDTVGDRWDLGYDTACEQILDLIDSLQQEQPEVDLEKAAMHVYESWMGGTMDDVRRDMVELGKALNARKEE